MAAFSGRVHTTARTAGDNFCTLADTCLMVNAQRSRHLGPEGKASPGQNQNTTSNLNSDLYFQRIKDNRVVERLLDKPAPEGPEPEVREAIRGYVQGYNRYPAETGVNNISDPACRGAAWVRPITELDVYRHAHAEIIMGSADALLDGQVNAAPPGAPAAAPPAPSSAKTAEQTAARIRDAMAVSRQQSMGSNALAVGSQGVSGGTSMLLANPHFPWQGKNRMWQSQLTIPGKVNVSGASLLGFPAVNIGYNENVAWSHTVATVAPFGLFDVQVDPLNPTTYLVDGVWERMTSQQVGVDVLKPDGSDFVGNANDSPWLANPEQPLTFPRVMGDTAAPRSLRTQELILTARNRINGTDGLSGKGFTPETMGKLLFADNSRAADLAPRRCWEQDLRDLIPRLEREFAV